METRSDRVDPLDGVPGMLSVDAFENHATLPEALSSVLRTLNGATSAKICGALLKCLPQAPPWLAAALLDIAVAADGSGKGNAYHDPTHSRDVGVIFANLMRLQAYLAGAPLPDVTDLLTGCCAAFGHDIGHDGGDGGGDGGPDAEPFRLERIAAGRVCAIMEYHTVDPHLVERAHCAIMATEVANGYRALDEAGRGALSADVPDCLSGLARRGDRETACLLRDSDVMQSAGLTPEDHDRQTARLEKERGIPANGMGVRGADFFLKDVIRGRFLSPAGHIFQPRLDRLVELNALRARSGSARGGLAAVARRASR